MHTERKFGCRKQLPDIRDKRFLDLMGRPLFLSAQLPPSVDLRPECPAVYDQGSLGSCTANAIAGVCEFDLIKQKKPVFVPSRLFIYYNERDLEGTVSWDSGANLRDGIKSLNLWGYAPEQLWPYDVSQFTVKPPQNVYEHAALDKVAVKDYGTVAQTLQEMKTVLAHGFPIVLGFTVYESFMSQQVAKTGIVPMPKPHESVQGGHAVAIVGYDKDGWIVRNSWGDAWGQKGYFIMPFQYFTNPHLAWDLWVVRLV